MLQRVQLRALLHQHEKQREQNSDYWAEATRHGKGSERLANDRWIVAQESWKPRRPHG